LAKLLEECNEICRIVHVDGVTTDSLIVRGLPAVENRGRLRSACDVGIAGFNPLELDAIKVVLYSEICYSLDKCRPVFGSGNVGREPNTPSPASDSNMGLNTLRVG
jgi:hypothetical protein